MTECQTLLSVLVFKFCLHIYFIMIFEILVLIAYVIPSPPLNIGPEPQQIAFTCEDFLNN